MKKWMGCLAAFSVAAALLLSGCGKPSVHVMKAQAANEPFTLETKATAEALHAAPVIPSVSGGLVTNPPDIGTVVEAGDILFQIDSSQYESQAAALEAQISQSAATSVSYAAPVDNSMEASLLKQGIITQAEYNRIKGRQSAPAVSHSGSVDESLVASLRSVQQLIGACTVRAPISGVISQIFLGDTHMAMAGKAALVIRQNSPVSATVEIPAKMDELLEAAKDDKTLTVSLSDGEDLWYGELKKQPNDDGEKYTAYKVQVDNADDKITIGNEYSIRIDSGKTVPSYMIPKSALIGDDAVAVVTESGLVDIKTVAIASETGGFLLIMDGLKEGDQVITDPPKDLEMGMQVDVK